MSSGHVLEPSSARLVRTSDQIPKAPTRLANNLAMQTLASAIQAVLLTLSAGHLVHMLWAHLDHSGKSCHNAHDNAIEFHHALTYAPAPDLTLRQSLMLLTTDVCHPRYCMSLQ